MESYANPNTQEQDIALPDPTDLDATTSDMVEECAWTALNALSTSSSSLTSTWHPPNRPGNGGKGKTFPLPDSDSETDDDLPIVDDGRGEPVAMTTHIAVNGPTRDGRGKLSAMAAHIAASQSPETVTFEATHRGPNALTRDNRTNLCPDAAGLLASASPDEIKAVSTTQLVHMSTKQPGSGHTAGTQQEQLSRLMASHSAEMPTTLRTTENAKALATLMRNILPGLGRNSESTTEISRAIYVLAKAVVNTSEGSKKRPKTKAELEERRKLRAEKGRLHRLAKKAQESANKIAASVSYSNPVTE